jgi:L-lactate dehydrogenase complex protein LldF
MSHSKAAKRFNSDEVRVNWHDQALWFVRTKRDQVTRDVVDWEKLRNAASEIKAHTLANLDTYLVDFEREAQKNGIQVHWAKDAAEHNEIVFKILDEAGASKVVKSKSMLTEECGLNPFLNSRDIEVIDTDLGERIVQMAKEPPSHIVLPAIHKRKEEVDTLFQEHLNTKPCNGDPNYLTGVARDHLRKKFINADAAITGVNFAVAETGELVISTNEGNADMGAHMASVHIACMGIEKVIPKQQHLGVFLRLLARSATGQPITTYTTHFKKPRLGEQLHVVIVDNGRSAQLGRPDFRASLHCIRCGACMNTCPVFRRSGGHSYGSTIPGPIGSILNPGTSLRKHRSLPFASTLCGSCTEVCPVKIDIHGQLLQWRQRITQKTTRPYMKRWQIRTLKWTFRSPGLYDFSGRAARWMIRNLPRKIVYSKINIWGRNRELPIPPEQSFKSWFKNEQGHEK